MLITFRKIHVKAKIIHASVHLFYRLALVALVYVQLYFCLVRWILLGLYCMLFRVRQWRESTFTLALLVPSLTPCTVLNKCDLKINRDGAEDPSTLQGLINDASHRQTPSLVFTTQVCQPMYLRYTPQGEATLLVLVCSLQSRLMSVGSSHLHKNFQLTCRVLPKV